MCGSIGDSGLRRSVWVCSGSLRSSITVSSSNDGKPRLRLRSGRRLIALDDRLSVRIEVNHISFSKAESVNLKKDNSSKSLCTFTFSLFTISEFTQTFFFTYIQDSLKKYYFRYFIKHKDECVG